jgi:nicotinate-nucleotide pyrophosphorylase
MPKIYPNFSGNTKDLWWFVPILKAERLVLNSMQRITYCHKTSSYVKLLEGTNTKIGYLETTPGFRVAEKWAAETSEGKITACFLCNMT